MTVVDGFPISSELVAFMHKMSIDVDKQESIVESNIGYLSEIQDYLCRHLGETPECEVIQVHEFLQEIIAMKDEFKELHSIFYNLIKE